MIKILIPVGLAAGLGGAWYAMKRFGKRDFAAPGTADTAIEQGATADLAAGPIAPGSASVAPGAPAVSIQDLAQHVADNVRSAGRGHDQALVAAYQAAAGIHVDGLYGQQTYASLRQYVPDAPGPLIEAAPIATHADEPVARALAPQVAEAIQAPGASPQHYLHKPGDSLLKQFQKAAVIPADGIWGGRSRGAVEFFMGQSLQLPSWADARPKTYRISGQDFTQSDLVREIDKTPGDSIPKRKLTAIFQRGEGLAVHGIVNPKTRAAMDRYILAN